jgi:hypothetical protein
MRTNALIIVLFAVALSGCAATPSVTGFGLPAQSD